MNRETARPIGFLESKTGANPQMVFCNTCVHMISAKVSLRLCSQTGYGTSVILGN